MRRGIGDNEGLRAGVHRAKARCYGEKGLRAARSAAHAGREAGASAGRGCGRWRGCGSRKFREVLIGQGPMPQGVIEEICGISHRATPDATGGRELDSP